ncbi:hypothetical protein [Propionibacterium australiense]|nr:hypothetical protein [Propionibacterium australiense]
MAPSLLVRGHESPARQVGPGDSRRSGAFGAGIVLLWGRIGRIGADHD